MPGISQDIHVSEQAELSEGVSDIVRDGTLAQAAVEAISDVAQQMLLSQSVDLMARALRRIFDVVPSAQRIAVVRWPPAEDGLRSLLPDAVLRREGLAETPVSMSMARYAVDSRKATFYFHGSNAHAAVSQAPSVVAFRLQTAVYVPLIGVNGEVQAVLCVDNPEPSLPLTTEDFHFIRAIGALLAAALHADQLREETHARELQAREVEAQRMAMSNSLQVAAHDLKNPLAVILMAAFAVERTPDAEERTRLVEQISLAARRARALVDTYLEAAAEACDTSSTSYVARHGQVDPRQIVEEEIAFLRSASEVEIEVRNEVSCRALLADPNKLRQIFGNLISNALKYSAAGSEVLIESEQGEGQVTFRVIDHGIGIPPEFKDSLGEPFQRLGDPNAREGTGLGLWITRGLIESHGGKLRLEETAGGGSTFVFWLPNARLLSAPSGQASSSE